MPFPPPVHHLAVAGTGPHLDRMAELLRALLSAAGAAGSCTRVLSEDLGEVRDLSTDVGFTGVALVGPLILDAPAAPAWIQANTPARLLEGFSHLTRLPPPGTAQAVLARVGAGVSAPPPRRIALSGFAGSGKSTVGRLLAERLGWSFLDTDTLVTAATGRSPAALIRAEGEAVFRAHEARALRRALGAARTVLALGGGTVTWGPSRAALAASAVIITLGCPLASCLARVDVQGRPLLCTGAEALYAARRDLYRDSSDLLVSSRPPAARTAESLAAQIATWWEDAP